MSEYFINSNNITVFPSVNRTHENSARYTEERITNMIYQFTPKNNLNDGFVVTSSRNSILGGEFEFNIQGYYFKILDVSELIEKIIQSSTAVALWASIKLDKDTDKDISYNLINTLSTSTPKTLDDNLAQFKGLRFTTNTNTTEKPSEITNAIALQILVRDSVESTSWYVPENSRKLIIPGYDNRDLDKVLVLDERKKLIWDEVTRVYILESNINLLTTKWDRLTKNDEEISIGDEVKTNDVISWQASTLEGYYFNEEGNPETKADTFTVTKRLHSIILPETPPKKLNIQFTPNYTIYGSVATTEDTSQIPYWSTFEQVDEDMMIKSRSGAILSTATATPADTKTYTISFDKNGGTGNVPANIQESRECDFEGNWSGYTSPIKSNQTVTANFIASMSGDKLPSATEIEAPEDMEFEAWNPKSDGSGTNYIPGGYVTGAEMNDESTPFILYAKWQDLIKTFTFTISGNDECVNHSLDTATHDGIDVLNKDVHTREVIDWTATTKTGYHFVETGTPTISHSTTVHNKEESSYHIDLSQPQYNTDVNKYTINFNTADINQGTVAPTQVLEVPHFTVISKIDNDKFNCNGTTITSTPNPDKTITITLDWNGGTGGVNTITQTHQFTSAGWNPESHEVVGTTTINASFAQTMNGTALPKGDGVTPPAEGQVFIGWHDINGTFYPAEAFLYEVYNDITLYAQWISKKPHTLHIVQSNCVIYAYGSYHGSTRLVDGNTVYEDEVISYYAVSNTGYHFGDSNNTTRHPTSGTTDITVGTTDVTITDTATANIYTLTINNTNCTVSAKGGDGRVLVNNSTIKYDETITWTVSWDDTSYEIRNATSGSHKITSNYTITSYAQPCIIIEITTDAYVTVNDTHIKIPTDKTGTFTINGLDGPSYAHVNNYSLILNWCTLSKYNNIGTAENITITPLINIVKTIYLHVRGQVILTYSYPGDLIGAWETSGDKYVDWNTIDKDMNSFTVDTSLVKDVIDVNITTEDYSHCMCTIYKDETDKIYTTEISYITKDSITFHIYEWKQQYTSEFGAGYLPTESIGEKVPGSITINKPSEEYYAEVYANGKWFSHFHYTNTDWIIIPRNEDIIPPSTGDYIEAGVNTYEAILYPITTVNYTVGASANPIEYDFDKNISTCEISPDTTLDDNLFNIYFNGIHLEIGIDDGNVDNSGKLILKIKFTDNSYEYFMVNVIYETVTISYVSAYGTPPSTVKVPKYVDYKVKGATASMNSQSLADHKRFDYWKIGTVRYNPNTIINPTENMKFNAVFTDNAVGECTITSNLIEIKPQLTRVQYYTYETVKLYVPIKAFGSTGALSLYNISVSSNNAKITVNYNSSTNQLEINCNAPTVTSAQITINATFKGEYYVATNSVENIIYEGELQSFTRIYGEDAILFDAETTGIIYYSAHTCASTNQVGIYRLIVDNSGETEETYYRFIVNKG